MYTSVHVAIFLIHKSPVRVPLLSSPDTKKGISGPELDRIDIHIEVPRVDYEKLSSDRVGETSESIRQRVQAAGIYKTNVSESEVS